jgi:hypothetical protein
MERSEAECEVIRRAVVDYQWSGGDIRVNRRVLYGFKVAKRRREGT